MKTDDLIDNILMAIMMIVMAVFFIFIACKMCHAEMKYNPWQKEWTNEQKGTVLDYNPWQKRYEWGDKTV